MVIWSSHSPGGRSGTIRVSLVQGSGVSGLDESSSSDYFSDSSTKIMFLMLLMFSSGPDPVPLFRRPRVLCITHTHTGETLRVYLVFQLRNTT